MIKYFFHILTFLIIYQLITSCANPTTPTGGPRDTIPPARINTIPKNQSTNYKGNIIVMEYDERIKTDKIKDQLIITPLIDFDYENTIKKNIIKLTFDGSFLDSTTYTLNFRESIQDLTEGNPSNDNKFTFSTGSFIDSMSVTGYVKDLLTYDTLENITVGLYNAEDTITIFNGSPYYFTELQEDGQYLIENIKNGKYFLYAFEDSNKNLKLETNSESYGFINDTLHLDTGQISKNIDLVKLDLTNFKLVTALSSGQYYEINFNKYVTNYSIAPIGPTHLLYSNLAKDNKSIRVYNNFEGIDSLQVTFNAIDSIGSEITDTVYVRFIESRRKKEEFTISVLPENNASIETHLNVEVKFNKPIQFVNPDSIFIQFDTTKIASVTDSILVWNTSKDHVQFHISIDRSKADTVLNQRNRLNRLKKDSIQSAPDEPQLKRQISRDKQEELPKLNRGLQLYFGEGAFHSADQDTSKAMGHNYKFIIPSENGIQEVNVETAYENFCVQLLTEKFVIEKEACNDKSIIFRNIKPGKYKIRVLIDENNDGYWSPGNMIKQIAPEPVYIYPELLVIRADWQTSLDITF